MSYVFIFIGIIAYSVFPVDYIAHRYNATAVNAGYLNPSVMIAVKPMEDEGVIPLLRLVDCEDATIRDGVRALLAQRQLDIEKSPVTHWTEFQGSRDWLAKRLAENESKWTAFLDESARQDAIDTFREYAMTWY